MQHTGLVALVDFGPGHSQQLWHRGTGEHVVLAGGWALSFAGGLAMLTPDGCPGDDRQPAWANSLLDGSMQKGTIGSADEGKVFVWSRTQQTHTPILIEIKAHIFRHGFGGAVFGSEVYKHTFPTAALQTVYWATPWLQDFIIGTDVHNKWACRNYKSWVELLRPIDTAYTSPMHTSTPMTVQGGTTFKLNYVHAMPYAMTHVLACCQWIVLLACLCAPPPA